MREKRGGKEINKKVCSQIRVEIQEVLFDI